MLMIFFPDTLLSVYQVKTDGFHTPEAKHMMLWLGIAHAALSFQTMAAAQCEYATQKKVLQYTMAGLFAGIYVVYKTRIATELFETSAWQKHAMVIVLRLGVALWACYIAAPGKAKVAGVSDPVMRNAIRFFYVQTTAYDVAAMFFQDKLMESFNMIDKAKFTTPELEFLCIAWGFPLATQACQLMAAAQCDAASQKKMLQYGMIGLAVTLWGTTKNTSFQNLSMVIFLF